MNPMLLRDIEYFKGVISRSTSIVEVLDIRKEVSKYQGNPEYKKLVDLADAKLEELKKREEEIMASRRK